VKKTLVFLICNTLWLLSCNEERRDRKQEPQAEKLDTVTSISQFLNRRVIFKAPNGEFYEIGPVVADSSAESFVTGRLGGKHFDCEKSDFTGTARKASKLSIAEGEDRTYNTLDELLSDIPASDDEMIDLDISTGARSKRTEYETRNVTLKRAYLFVCKREHNDNDYHIIISSKKNGGDYFNVECSGLPPKNYPSYETLLDLRSNFESFIGGSYCSEGWRPLGGIPVEITGSLFYDADHKPGIVGPSGHRPKTAWEIHPLTRIKFLHG
jgi:hypothetical protein